MAYEAGTLKEEQRNDVAILKLSGERPNKKKTCPYTDYVYAGSKMRRFVTSNKREDNGSLALNIFFVQGTLCNYLVEFIF